MTDNDTTDDTTEESLTDQFAAAQTGPFRYTVQSTRNDDTTVHRVDIQEVACSCEDMTYNHTGSRVTPTSDGGASVCDHIRFVIDIHPQLEALESGVYQAMGLMQEANTIKQNIKDQSDQLENAIVQLRDAQAGLEASNNAGGESSADGAAETEITDDSPPGGMTDEDVERAAEDLQEAFDEHLTDMEVQAHAGHVWFKTGYDTEEEWPYPGVDDTFQAITAPDVVEYAYESDDGPNHELYSEKPGEYWKNALDPQDVDEYIAEVLE